MRERARNQEEEEEDAIGNFTLHDLLNFLPTNKGISVQNKGEGVIIDAIHMLAL